MRSRVPSGLPVELVIYPSAARGFDFRTVGRTLSDDLAKMDSMYRTVEFLNRYLGRENPGGPTLGPLAAAPLAASVRLPSAGVYRKSGRTYLYRNMTEWVVSNLGESFLNQWMSRTQHNRM